jgi:signal transduction histidine kinase
VSLKAALHTRLTPSQRDLISVVCIVTLVYLTAMQLDLNERFMAWAQPQESWQLDEIPYALIAAAAMSAWFSRRRLNDQLLESKRRAKAEKALGQSQQLYEKLFNEGLSGNVVADLAGNILLANDAFKTMSGQSYGQISLGYLLGEVWPRLLFSLQLNPRMDFAKLILNRPDGKPWIVMARMVFVPASEVAATGRIYAFITDITEQHLAEQELAQLLTENKLLVRHALQMQEDERKNLAREIHDDMGQYLTAIRMDVHALQISAPAAAAEFCSRIAAHAEYIQLAVQRLVKQLRPVMLDHGLVEGLQQLVQQWRVLHPQINCALEIADAPHDLSASVNIVVYRMVQEALTNTAKHAQASCVDIRLSLLADNTPLMLSIEVSDDGVGFVGRPSAHGFGLTGMRERIESVDGILQLLIQAQSGVKLSARIPITVAIIDESSPYE